MEGGEKITGLAIICRLASDPSPFDDNVRGLCKFCHRAVQHRPHVPTPNTLVCIECYQERVEDDDTHLVSQRTLEELLALAQNRKV